jgi:hypothetical protein
MGPASSTVTGIAIFSSNTGKAIQSSTVTIDVSNNLSTAGNLSTTGSGYISTARPIFLGTYTVAGLPTASSWTNAIAIATNANAGNGAAVRSDGANWIDMSSNRAASTDMNSAMFGAQSFTPNGIPRTNGNSSRQLLSSNVTIDANNVLTIPASGNLKLNSPAFLGTYTVAGLPAAASWTNAIAIATNANGGGGTIAKSNGTSWLDIVQGKTVTTATNIIPSIALSDTAPSSPSNGDFWFNSSQLKLKVRYFDGTNTQWVDVLPTGGSSSTGVSVGDVAPASPTNGALWWDSTVGKLRIYYTDSDSSQWVDATWNGNVSNLQLSSGTAGSPSLSFSGDTGTGLYLASAGNLGIRAADTVWVGSGTTPATTTTPIQSGTTAKAFGRFVGSTATISKSYNVSSVVRNSLGAYTVNFTQAMPDANFIVVGAGEAGSNNVADVVVYARTTTSVSLGMTFGNGNNYDATVNFAIFSN